MARVFKKNSQDAAWWIDYSYKGRRHRQKIGAKRKAEDALALIRAKIAAGEFVSPDERKNKEAFERQPVLFEDFARDEYLPWSEVNHSAKHHSLQESIIRAQLVPYLGGNLLHEITPKHLDDYVTQRLRKRVPWSKRKRRQVKEATVNRDIACLKVLFRKAVEWGKLDESPAGGLRAFKEIPNPPRLLEGEEVARLLDEMPDHLRALVGCAVYAGLRKQELFHLRWEDVNQKTGELKVVSRIEHPTKNRETRRIPMNEPLAELIRRHPRRLGSRYVFANREGLPYDNVKVALRGAARRAGIEDGVTMHQLRHAFCSHSMMQGIDARTVQIWMGHRDLATTLRYSHLSADHEKAAIQRLQYNTWHQDGTKAEGT